MYSANPSIISASKTSTWGNIKQCTHYSESRRREQSLIVEEFLSKSNITLNNIGDFPTMEKLYKESSKIKVQAHSDLIVDEIQDYGLDIDVVVEANFSLLVNLALRGFFLISSASELVSFS